jgi:hypothetical protein
MKINGAYKFRTQAITGRLRLLFRYNSIIPVFVNGGWQPAFIDQVFVELGVTGGYKELFKNSCTVEDYAPVDCFFVSGAAYHKSVNGGWILGFVAEGDDRTPGGFNRSRRLETMKLNTFIGFASEQNITKRYPEVSSNDISAGWLLNSSDYSAWESLFLLGPEYLPVPIKQDSSLHYGMSYLGGGVWGRYHNSELIGSPFPEFERFVASAYFTEENEYLINTIKNSRFLSSDPPFTTETYLHPLFNIRKPWILPGFRYYPWLFSEDRKELIYIKTYVELFSDRYYSPSIKEVYYAKFSDTGDILEDTLIVDLQYYENLPDNHPDKLANNDPIPELPFWRIFSYKGHVGLEDTGSVSRLSRFRSGKIEWVDKEDLESLASGVGISLTPEVIESLLTRDYFNVKITQWNGQKFTEPETKKYKVTPTNQDIIDFYKTNNIFNPDKYIASFNLFGIAFY